MADFRDHTLEELEALKRDPQIGVPALRRIQEELDRRAQLAELDGMVCIYRAGSLESSLYYDALRAPGACPRCRRWLQWEATTVTNGNAPERVSAITAECGCGLEVRIPPDGPASVWPQEAPPPADDLFLAALRQDDTTLNTLTETEPPA